MDENNTNTGETEECNACNDENKKSGSVCYCKDCKEFLCNEHLDEHKAFRVTKNHVTVSVSEGILTQRDLSFSTTASTESFSTQKLPDRLHVHVNIGNVDPDSQKNQCRPGKPECQFVTADTISLVWTKPDRFGTDDVYQLCFKSVDDQAGRWKPCIQELKDNKAKLQDFKSDTSFIFRVRVLYGNDEEGPYSQPSDPIKTQQSLAIKILQRAQIKDGNSVPEIRSLPITHVSGSKNTEAKSQKFEFGPSEANFKGKEKTIMLVGETGSGKSTMLNGMVNYILGVNFDDPVRYTIVHMEDEEKQKQNNQARSQTDWITYYTLYPMEGSRIDYTLNIIDTPGFGDTRGLPRDKQLFKQIHELFSCRDARGVLSIDAICFLVKAPDARLTPTQTYIFESIMSLFGKNVEKNICSLITFADDECPPVLSSLKQSGLPFGNHFTFNNCALFANNQNLGSTSLSPIYWDKSLKRFCSFFESLENMYPTSLEQTKDVLDTRQNLETTIQNLLPKIDVGLSTLSSIKKQIEFIKQHKLDIEQNRDFLIPVKYPVVTERDTKPGQFVTNCMTCNFTCHRSCAYSDNEEKIHCCAMSNGNCTECNNKCHWTQHKNMSTYFEIEIKEKFESFAKKQKIHEEATGEKGTCERIVKEMGNKFLEIKKDIDEMTKTITSCNNKLKDIAIRTNPLTLVKQIEILIESEYAEKRKGYEDRVEELQLYKREAQYDDVVHLFEEKEISVSEELAEHVEEEKPGFIKGMIDKLKRK